MNGELLDKYYNIVKETIDMIMDGYTVSVVSYKSGYSLNVVRSAYRAFNLNIRYLQRIDMLIELAHQVCVRGCITNDEVSEILKIKKTTSSTIRNILSYLKSTSIINRKYRRMKIYYYDPCMCARRVLELIPNFESQGGKPYIIRRLRQVGCSREILNVIENDLVNGSLRCTPMDTDKCVVEVLDIFIKYLVKY